MAVFNPNIPVAHTENDAAEMRENFLAVHDEATAPETDPVFAAAEAALLVEVDKAKLDAALQTVPLPLIGYDAGYVTGEYTPADPSHWAGSPPAMLAEALDRLAAAVSNNGASPIA